MVVGRWLRSRADADQAFVWTGADERPRAISVGQLPLHCGCVGGHDDAAEYSSRGKRLFKERRQSHRLVVTIPAEVGKGKAASLFIDIAPRFGRERKV